jgi:hypothetical protein
VVVANFHAVSTRSPHNLTHRPFTSGLAFALARVGGLITSSRSLSGFGHALPWTGAAALVASTRLVRWLLQADRI